MNRWSRFIGLGIYYLAAPGRRVAFANLDRVYGDSLSRAEKKAIAKASFINLASAFSEACYAPMLPPPYSQWVKVLGVENLLEAHRRGKGIILLVPHMGSWEGSAKFFSEHLPVVHVVARRQTNPWLALFLEEVREFVGANVIDNKDSLFACLSALRRGETVIMLIDQHLSRGGVSVNFLGHPAMTSAAPALLAAKTGAAALVGASYRREDGSLGGIISPIIEPILTEDSKQDMVANTQRYVDIIGEYVKEHPKDWMWMHRRWRTPRIRKPKTPAP